MGFTFSESTVELEVCGKIYRVDPYAETLLIGMKNYREAIAEIQKETDKDTPEAIHKLCAATGKLVDVILGDNAYKDIIQGRENDFLAHQELTSYLLSSVQALRIARVKQSVEKGQETAKAILDMSALQ